MTINDRVTKLEDAFVQIGDRLAEHSTLLQDIVTLLNAQSDQLEKIERAIRERGTNGHT